jgi:hypothetical protein
VKQGVLHCGYVYHTLKPVAESSNSNNIDLHDLDGKRMRAGDRCQIFQREKQPGWYRSWGDRGLFIACAMAMVNAPQTAVHARKPIGYAARVATGITTIA